LERRIETLEKENAALREENAALREENAALREENAALRKRVGELEAQLGQNSTNSHKPPSSDPPGTRPASKPTGQRRGGQPGHEPHTRQRLPPEQVTRTTDVRPERCKQCGGLHLSSVGEPRWHQVLDVPPQRPDVHEWRLFGGECADCGTTTWAQLPAGVPAHIFAPRLQALIAYLLSTRMSRRQVQESLRELFGVSISLGALSDTEQRVSEAVAAPVDEAIAHAQRAPVKHVDASSWRQSGAFRSLWTIATKLVTVFVMTADGTKESVAGLLVSLRGFLITDRGSQFGFWAMAKRQICWAHLIRKFVAFSERQDAGAQLGEWLLLFARETLAKWHRVRDGTLSRAAFVHEMAPIQVAIEYLLARGVELRLEGLSGSCQNILEHREALFTFVHNRGVAPTNNDAERALRPFVIWRKVSFGSQSERGCLFAQRIMTVAQTLRQQKRSVFAFLVGACQAALDRSAPPSLLPATQ
jgi:transposase